MKNRRISGAYDSINPSPEQKVRMLDSILQQVDFQDAPRGQRQCKTSGHEKTVVCKKQPEKKRRCSWIGPVAACVALCAVCGFVLTRMAGKPPAEYTAPEPATEKIDITVNFDYSDVLSKYRTALREGWSKDQCEIEGISTRFYLPEPVDFTIGQRMRDINGDGRAELLIGHDEYIWDLYTTLEDGTPIQLLSDIQDGWQYYLSEEGTIAAEYYGKEDCYVEYYRLDGHQLVMEQQLQYKDGQWQYQLAGQEWEPISAEEVQNITDAFAYWHPDWILLTEAGMTTDFRPAEELYTPVLEKYITELRS